MYGRKELETFYKTSCVEDSEFYHKDAADKVMDAMEVHIKELEAENKRRVIHNMELTNDNASYKNQLENLHNESERLKDEVKRLEDNEEFLANEQVKILDERDNLRKENNQLKFDVDLLSMRRDNFCDAMYELVEKGAVDTFDWTGGLVTLAKDANYEELRKENAKLRCLALHAMREYFKAMSALNSWREEYYGETKYLHRVIHYDKLTKQYDYAYRREMLALMEGK